MSNYYTEAKRPKGKKFEKVLMMDNCYGHHLYGVQFPDGSIFREEKCLFRDTKKLSLEELDKLIVKDLKRAYNEGIKACIKSITENLNYCMAQNGLDHCKNCGLNAEQLKKLKVKCI